MAKGGQHHEHQLGWFWPTSPKELAIRPNGASIMKKHQLGRFWPMWPKAANIMSISWAGFGPHRRRTGHEAKRGQHHEHQLGRFWPMWPKAANVMSISWAGFGPHRQRTGHEAKRGQHHEHQLHHEHRLGWFWPTSPKQLAMRPNGASIMSISWAAFGPCGQRRPTS